MLPFPIRHKLLRPINRREKVCSLIPRLRMISATDVPDSIRSVARAARHSAFTKASLRATSRISDRSRQPSDSVRVTISSTATMSAGPSLRARA